jgi:hypothetical protein
LVLIVSQMNPVYITQSYYTKIYLNIVDPLLSNDLEKKTTKQHLLIGNRFLISKYTQPLLGNTFANKHVPTETTVVQQ